MAKKTNYTALSKKEKYRAENYLHGNRDKAVLDLAVDLGSRDMDVIIKHLKKAIYSYVNWEYSDFKGYVNLSAPACQVLKNFDTEAFKERKWKHVPYYLTKKDFDEMQGCVKNPIFVKRYDLKTPLNRFANSAIFSDAKDKLEITRQEIKMDTKYYLSENEDMLFAKTTVLKFKPKSLKYFGQKIEDFSSEDKKKMVYNKNLYDRSLSITQYILLEGDPNKAVSIVRFDDDINIHTNVFVGYDLRKYAMGESAGSPHFHFQNEEDMLLCLRKFASDNGEKKYRTGRANAIDCRRLRKYLVRIDKEDLNNLKAEFKQNQTYGLPFLRYKLDENIQFNIDPVEIFENYVSTLNGGGTCKAVLAVREQIESTKNFEEYKINKQRKFGGLIKAIDIIHFVSSLIRVEADLEQVEILVGLEIMLADAIIDAVNLNTKSILMQDGKPKYQLSENFDNN